MPPSLEINAFLSFTLAILLLFIGKGLTQRWFLLRRYSIPEPVVGGALCAAMRVTCSCCISSPPLA